MGCPGRWWSHRPWRCSRSVWMLCWGTWFSENHWWWVNGWTGWSCWFFPTFVILWFYGHSAATPERGGWVHLWPNRLGSLKLPVPCDQRQYSYLRETFLSELLHFLFSLLIFLFRQLWRTKKKKKEIAKIGPFSGVTAKLVANTSFPFSLFCQPSSILSTASGFVVSSDLPPFS